MRCKIAKQWCIPETQGRGARLDSVMYTQNCSDNQPKSHRICLSKHNFAITLIWCQRYELLLVEDRRPFILCDICHGYWRAGDARGQTLSSHGIEFSRFSTVKFNVFILFSMCMHMRFSYGYARHGMVHFHLLCDKACYHQKSQNHAITGWNLHTFLRHAAHRKCCRHNFNFHRRKK